ncbi:Fungal specific transcription factor [Metarhizium guizhouense ARSEF 977]|uniref:Fungal specific transcription factor n=1 Tax=Metarhizium guizhouense (strain ARSEF 977) TaxID=1276136 RepID=A0A0B4GU80_METGA|nr:Fungal specific transcription factor [Metarhizium guizhouense ARSEF 977]
MEDDNGRQTPGGPGPPRYIRSRIANACDGCKARKVKCDGKLPCGYCAGRQRPQACHYSPQRRRTTASRRVSKSVDDEGVGGRALRTRPAAVHDSAQGASTPRTRDSAARTADHRQAAVNVNGPAEPSAEDDTEVPREARLLCDAQGKLVFIGDCAPLSFFQSVRQLVTSRVGQHAFAPESSRYSVLENVPAGYSTRERAGGGLGSPPDVGGVDFDAIVASYLATTTGLADLFDNAKLLSDLLLWANHERGSDELTSVVNYLVLAIGSLKDHEARSQGYFEYARSKAYATLSGNLSVGTVQAFILITIYMLCSCQINGAYLFFGIAARAAYSIGIHRTEVNARFGAHVHRQRDRLWKSVRIVDLFLSTSMGRPPSASDVDCTVPYRNVDGNGDETFDLLNASVQILLITETVVVEIYSRRKISLQLTEGISHQLRDWSGRWLQQLKDVIARTDSRSTAEMSGACQVLSSYYYAVMLVSRPFLMYELVRRLSDSQSAAGRSPLTSGKSKLADACIDAASLMVDPILDLIDRGIFNSRAPLIVSWLFASALVLGVGLLGGFGRILEKYCRMSIQALDHFAKADGHATQYSLIAQSLLMTALEYLERRELQERLRRTENSSQLFGLMPSEPRTTPGESTPGRDSSQHTSRSPAAVTFRGREPLDRSFLQHQGLQGVPSPRLAEIDSAFLGLTESLMQTPDDNYWNGNVGNDGDAGSALNLFPLLEAGGGIDLAHYF